MRSGSGALLPTLEALCAHNGHKAATARAIGLQRPSLYHRIARLEQLLDASLSGSTIIKCGPERRYVEERACDGESGAVTVERGERLREVLERDAEKKVAARWRLFEPECDERRRRLWAATEARTHGSGGVALVARATGIAQETIRRGLAELDSDERLEPGRVRRPGGGRCVSAPNNAARCASNSVGRSGRLEADTRVSGGEPRRGDDPVTRVRVVWPSLRSV